MEQRLHEHEHGTEKGEHQLNFQLACFADNPRHQSTGSLRLGLASRCSIRVELVWGSHPPSPLTETQVDSGLTSTRKLLGSTRSVFPKRRGDCATDRLLRT